MKKLLLAIAILFSLNSFAQPGNIDTVKANLTMKASEWAYYISYMNGSKDSADIQFIRRVRTKVQSMGNLTWNTNIQVDTVRGRYIVAIYNIGRRIPAGEAVQVGLSALNTIASMVHPVIQYYIGSIDNGHQSGFNQHRDLGKAILVDN